MLKLTRIRIFLFDDATWLKQVHVYPEDGLHAVTLYSETASSKARKLAK